MTHKHGLKRHTISGADIVNAVAEFDEEFVADTFGPPSPRATMLWQRAKRARGRPKRGRGAKVISISVERSLLERSDSLARRMEVSRAELVARGLKAMLAAEGEI